MIGICWVSIAIATANFLPGTRHRFIHLAIRPLYLMVIKNAARSSQYYLRIAAATFVADYKNHLLGTDSLKTVNEK